VLAYAVSVVIDGFCEFGDETQRVPHSISKTKTGNGDISYDISISKRRIDNDGNIEAPLSKRKRQQVIMIKNKK